MLIEIAFVLLLYESDFNGYIMTKYRSKVIDIKVRQVINTVTYIVKNYLIHLTN